MSPVYSIMVTCPEIHALLCERLVFNVAYGRSRVYILFVNSANRCLSRFGGNRCGLEASNLFIIVRFSAMGDDVCPNLRVRVTVQV